MTLLIDTDAFCKLGVAELLPEAVRVLGVKLPDCRRLPALPYMLRRGRLRNRYGAAVCDALVPLADSMAIIDQPSDLWLERFVGIEAIDPGEAQILAVAAEFGSLVLTDDKRALRAAKAVDGLAGALAGRIITLEAILAELCEQLGPEVVRGHVKALRSLDTITATCFSEGTSDPRDGLRSYCRGAVNDLAPLVLWKPQEGIDDVRA